VPPQAWSTSCSRWAGSLGLAVLVAVYGTATRNAAAHPAAGLSGVALQHQVLAHGMSTAFGLAAIFDVAVLVLVLTLLRARKPKVPDTPADLIEDEVTANAIGDTIGD